MGSKRGDGKKTLFKVQEQGEEVLQSTLLPSVDLSTFIEKPVHSTSSTVYPMTEDFPALHKQSPQQVRFCTSLRRSWAITTAFSMYRSLFTISSVTEGMMTDPQTNHPVYPGCPPQDVPPCTKIAHRSSLSSRKSSTWCVRSHQGEIEMRGRTKDAPKLSAKYKLDHVRWSSWTNERCSFRLRFVLASCRKTFSWVSVRCM